MTFCWLSLVTMMGWWLVLVYSAMLPVMNGVWLWKSDWQLTRKSVNSLPVVHARCRWKPALLSRALIPLVSAGRAGVQVIDDRPGGQAVQPGALAHRGRAELGAGELAVVLAPHAAGILLSRIW